MVPTQETADGEFVIYVDSIEPFAIKPLISGPKPQESANQDLNAFKSGETAIIENHLIRYEFDAHGDIVRIFDKEAKREVLPAGAKANVFQAFEDRPMKWDAWDIDIFYDDKEYSADSATLLQITETGPLRATVRMARTILNSTIQQNIHRTRGENSSISTPPLTGAKNTFCKAAFPVDVLSPTATFDAVMLNGRPIGTPRDWARFTPSPPAGRSAKDYGAACSTTAIWADIRDNVIVCRCCAARPIRPMRQGHHEFTYSLLPHSGDGDRPQRRPTC